jgi:hypothetical protein
MDLHPLIQGVLEPINKIEILGKTETIEIIESIARVSIKAVGVLSEKWLVVSPKTKT